MVVSIILIFTDFTLSDHLVDLLQVDVRSFLVSRVSFLGRQASDKVARGRLVSLEGFSFAFLGPQNGEWYDLLLGFQVTFVSPFQSDKNNQTCVCFSNIKIANLFTLC